MGTIIRVSMYLSPKPKQPLIIIAEEQIEAGTVPGKLGHMVACIIITVTGKWINLTKITC